MNREHMRQYAIVSLLVLASAIMLCAGIGAASARERVVDLSTSPEVQLIGGRDTTPTLQFSLNIPSFRLDVFEHGVLTRSYPVATGMPRYRTPIGSFRIDHVTWNPWWRPPDSEWARNERPRAPGWKNPVGRVKMRVHDEVYLHGSPFENSMGSAASHGCIRMRNVDAMALARMVHEHAGPKVDAALLDSLVADTRRTTDLTLARAVPFHVHYALVEVRQDTLILYRDVYQLGGTRVPTARSSVMRALDEKGIDTALVAPARLRALIQAARRSTTRLPIESLYAPPGVVRK